MNFKPEINVEMVLQKLEAKDAEIKRLREALQEIANPNSGIENGDYIKDPVTYWYDIVMRLRNRARKALEGKE